jgi:methanogenic corrinoid protein MtbC1
LAECGEVVGRYLELVLAGRRGEALEAALGPLERGELDLAALYDEVLSPAASEIGERWHGGSITVADEHLATHLARYVMAQARGIAGEGTGGGRGTVVLACPPAEQHELALEMLSDLLERAGFDVRLLGAATPARDLTDYVRRERPDLIAFSCATALAMPGLLTTIAAVRAASPESRIVIGGRAVAAYPTLGRVAGVDATCDSLTEAVSVIGALVADGVPG